MSIKRTEQNLLLAAMLWVLVPMQADAQTTVIVNGAVLDAQTHQGLEQTYRTRLVPGRYWYDSVSGLWGIEGGPSLGQIVAGLRMGYPLASNASVRSRWLRTGVYVNGREIHPRELNYLQSLYGPVQRGRYWLNARGIAGFEGGPPQFDLRAAALARSPQNRGTGTGQRGIFGNTGSDGRCAYYNDPESGASVLSGQC